MVSKSEQTQNKPPDTDANNDHKPNLTPQTADELLQGPTAVVPQNLRRLRRLLDHEQSREGGAIHLVPGRELVLVVRGMIERVHITHDQPLVLGRFETGGIAGQQIDLTPYGALDRGVSREHLRLTLDDEQLHITDLDSTNGTFIAGKRLSPQQPHLLHSGDQVLLGRLCVQILFR